MIVDITDHSDRREVVEASDGGVECVGAGMESSVECWL